MDFDIKFLPEKISKTLLECKFDLTDIERWYNVKFIINVGKTLDIDEPGDYKIYTECVFRGDTSPFVIDGKVAIFIDCIYPEKMLINSDAFILHENLAGIRNVNCRKNLFYMGYGFEYIETRNDFNYFCLNDKLRANNLSSGKNIRFYGYSEVECNGLDCDNIEFIDCKHVSIKSNNKSGDKPHLKAFDE